MWTIGHSNRVIGNLLEILQAHRIDLLVDVRTVPRSRHNPQFNRETLPATLAAAGIDYLHIAALGGLRRPRKDSVNIGWRNDSFRGYADYMQTGEFAGAIEDLLAAAGDRRAAVMCAEAVPWRCHRSLIADALVARGLPVFHIMSAARADEHKLTPFARIDGEHLTYPTPLPNQKRLPLD
jgi:uncharacterized protein (DUF488 family)